MFRRACLACKRERAVLAKKRDPEPPPADSFERLIHELAKLPGVGRRSAERMAYHLLEASRDEAMNLAFAIRDVKKNLRPCPQCGDLTEAPLCIVCRDPKRDQGLICVVEWPREVRAIEKSGEYRGTYHVLMGRLSPLAGIEPEDLRIASLVERLRQGQIREVLMATSPTMEGDATAAYISEQTRAIQNGERAVRITRLARGLPAGSELSFAQSGTIGAAIRGRADVGQD